jgi:sugar/nucleoside kinase (ribokinase family)
VLLDDGSRPAGLAALDRARRAGWTTSVDPQAAVHIATAGAENFLSWVAGADLLLPNDSELAALGGLDPVLAAVGAVVVTHGRHGASWYSATDRVNVPAPEAHETDSTGAGDAFNAGLLSSWRPGPIR